MNDETRRLLVSYLRARKEDFEQAGYVATIEMAIASLEEELPADTNMHDTQDR